MFDICYLSESADKDKMKKCIQKYIYEDESLAVEDINEIIRRVEHVFNNIGFIREINRSKKNWLDIGTEEAIVKAVQFIKSLQ